MTLCFLFRQKVIIPPRPRCYLTEQTFSTQQHIVFKSETGEITWKQARKSKMTLHANILIIVVFAVVAPQLVLGASNQLVAGHRKLLQEASTDIDAGAVKVAETIAAVLSQQTLDSFDVVNFNVQLGNNRVTIGYDEALDKEEQGTADPESQENTGNSTPGSTGGNSTDPKTPEAPDNEPDDLRANNRKVDLKIGGISLVTSKKQVETPDIKCTTTESTPWNGPRTLSIHIQRGDNVIVHGFDEGVDAENIVKTP